MSRLSRWSTLVASWVLYWLLLAGIKLGPAIAAIWRVTRSGGPEGSSSVNFSAGDQGLILHVTKLGREVYTASTSIMGLVLWIGVPPLILWFVWAWLRSRQIRERETV